MQTQERTRRAGIPRALSPLSGAQESDTARHAESGAPGGEALSAPSRPAVRLTAAAFVQEVLDNAWLHDQITGYRVLEDLPARFRETQRPWPKAIQEVLDRMGVSALYSHQALAMDKIRAGQDVVVTTPTASGKTLIYNLPYLERRLQDRDATALYLFPLKALAQDQRKTLVGLTAHWPEHARPRVCLYDGDTPPAERSKIRKDPPAVLVTNPEMLHLGILPHHENWTTFLASLSLIVLDEAHIYRGVFGAHMACLLQRLARITARYNAHPVHVLCTATLGNPGQLGLLLLGSGQDPFVVGESGAPRGKRHMIFMEPEASPSSLAIELLKKALRGNLRTIVYCRSRRMTELISLWVSQQARSVSRRISAYRAGYLPEERREIEERMASGDLLAVVSTSALELGIDIGALDVCILVGYPGSIMATLQRGGRVGRKGQESCVLLLGGEDALDQYFVHNPDQFFSRPPENAMLNPDNPVIVERHLECAAAESPLRASEPWLGKPAVQQCALELERQGLLLRSKDGTALLAARKSPQRNVSLRGSGASFQIVDEGGRVIGSVDAHQAFRETHEGAVYIHRGVSYTIAKLDLGARLAHARPHKVRYHTNVRTQKSTEILSTSLAGQVFGMPVYLGRLRVTEQITGYERRDNGTRRLLDILPLELPPQIFETEGLWMCIPEETSLAVEEQFYHFMGSIHALEHVSIGLMPLLVMADRNDFGGISTPMHPQVGGAAVFVYDGLPGGAGLARGAFTHLDELLDGVEKTLAQCPCETGCPSCIQPPKCGSGNRPLDKAGALFLVRDLLRHRDKGLTWHVQEESLVQDEEDREPAPAQEETQHQDRTQGQEVGQASGNTAEERSVLAEELWDGPVPDQMPVDSAQEAGLPDNLPDDMFGELPELLPEDLSNVLSENVPMDFLGDLPEDLPEDFPENLPEDLPEDVPDPGPGADGGSAAARDTALEAAAEAVTRPATRTARVATVQSLAALLGPGMGAPGAGEAAPARRTKGASAAKTGRRAAKPAPVAARSAEDAVQGAASPAFPAARRVRKTYNGPIVVFDVETRRSATDVGGWQNAHRMGVSVLVCHDGTGYRAYGQDELAGFFELVRHAGLVVGFNSFRFDYKVLQPFAPFRLQDVPGLDILAEVYKHLHYRLSLDNLGQATLGRAKSAHGLEALDWWKEGRVEEIRAYCQQDVELTLGLFEFGREHGYLLFHNKAGQSVRVPVSW